MESVLDGAYVRLNGHLKTFQGKKQLLVFSVRPITDFNEVTFHYIECIHFYSRNSESQLGQQVGDVTHSHMVNSSVNTNQATILNPVVSFYISLQIFRHVLKDQFLVNSSRQCGCLVWLCHL